MTRRNVVIVLKERDLQEFFRAVLDRDGELALKFLDEVVRPRVERELGRPHCRPAFEMTGPDLSAIAPPPLPQTRPGQENEDA